MGIETSIIIRTRNEERHLERLLVSIRGQTYTAWEIVLVDSGSTDATLDIARRYISNIHQISPDEFTFGRSLNLGCRHAVGQYLVFVSAHTFPLNNTWLSNLVRPFGDPLIAMVYGRQRGVESSRLSEQRDLEFLFGMTSKILIDEPFGNNANAAIRRDRWVEEPFDETLPGLEDRDWARKIQRRGYRVYYAPDAAIYHIHDESLRQVYQRFFREGVAHRRIFPGYRFDKIDLMKGVVYNSVADCLYVIRRRKPLRKIVQVFPTRIAENMGRYRGLYHHKQISRELRHRLDYPKRSESVVIQAAGQHGIQETDIPQVGPGEVLIQVAYVGVCATDLDVAEGNLEYYQKGYARYPIVPGHEYSGIVVETGTGVRGLRKGDKVVGECAIGCGKCPACKAEEFYRCTRRKEVGVINMNGAYARYTKIPAQYVHKLPAEILLKEAALVEPLAVCLKGLRKLGVNRGGVAYVVGGGPLGNFCAQILKHRGAEVTVVDRDERRLRLLYKYDLNTRTEIGLLESFDYLVEASGDQEVIPYLIEKSKPSAKILLLGLPYERPVQVSFSTVPCYDKEIYGSIASERKDWKQAVKLLRDGTINLDDHTATVLPLESYETAWKAIKMREVFKVLLSNNAVLDGF